MRNILKATTLESKLPLLAVEHGCIISKDADITVAFEVSLPELFTVTSAEYEAMHGAWCKAIKVLPHYSVVHKQDWFCSEKYQPNSRKMTSLSSTVLLNATSTSVHTSPTSASCSLPRQRKNERVSRATSPPLPWANYPEGTQSRDGCQVHGVSGTVRANHQ